MRNICGTFNPFANDRKAPNVLTGVEIRMLVKNLPARERTLVLLATATGRGQGELFGLEWRDVDREHGELNVGRSIVFGVEGSRKTESSQKPVPLRPQLAAALIEWRKALQVQIR
jgi:integrase